MRHVAVRFEGLETLAKKLKHTREDRGADVRRAEGLPRGGVDGGVISRRLRRSDGDDDFDPYAEEEPKSSTRLKARDARLAVVVERLEYARKGAPVTSRTWSATSAGSSQR